MKNFLLLFMTIAAFLTAAGAYAVDFGGCPDPANSVDTNLAHAVQCSVGATDAVSQINPPDHGVLPCGTINNNGETVIIEGVEPVLLQEVCSHSFTDLCVTGRIFRAAGGYISSFEQTDGSGAGNVNYTEVGVELINGVFRAINTVIDTIGETLYNHIIDTTDYKVSLNALVAIYIGVYGLMIALGLASARPGEVLSRLLKVAIVYWLLIPGADTGWVVFDQYLATPILNAMNEIITVFMNVSNGQYGNVPPTTTTPSTLSAVSVLTLSQPLDLVFSKAFCIVVLGHIFLGTFGWFFALAMVWCALEVFLMLFGAIVTYIKSIVGLLFLFSLGPIIIPFILFENTKKVFFGWLSLVFGFFLEPVLLFAFFGFFIFILNDQLISTMYPNIGTPYATDFCWVRWFKFGIIDIYWWRPIRFFATAATEVNGDGGYPNGAWHGSSPLNFSDILYLLFLIHIGKAIIKFIGHLSHDLSGGQGTGIVRSADVGRWFSNNLFGGRRPGEIAADLGGAALYGSRNAYDRLSGRGDRIANMSYGQNSNASQGADNETVFSDAAGATTNATGSGNASRIDASVTPGEASKRLNALANKINMSPAAIAQMVQVAAQGSYGDAIAAETQLLSIASRTGVSVGELKRLVHESGRG